METHVGQQLGNYRLIRLLGQGGFADVYLGEHIHLGTQAALKVLQMRLVGEHLELFRQEARTIAALRHPNIVHVFEFGVEAGTPYLVMDYAPHGSLRQRYSRGSIVPPQPLVAIVKQVAAALFYAHHQRLIHRDIKPENMLLGPNDEVLLSDFGLVLVEQSTGSQLTREAAGTLPYMAPEQLQGKPRAASDQYSLGIVVYEWLCGARPFHGGAIELMGQHAMTPPPPLRQRVPNIPPAVEAVVLKALAKNPQERFPDVQAFATALESACYDALARPISGSGSLTEIRPDLNPTALGAIPFTEAPTRPGSSDLRQDSGSGLTPISVGPSSPPPAVFPPDPSPTPVFKQPDTLSEGSPTTGASDATMSTPPISKAETAFPKISSSPSGTSPAMTAPGPLSPPISDPRPVPGLFPPPGGGSSTPSFPSQPTIPPPVQPLAPHWRRWLVPVLLLLVLLLASSGGIALYAWFAGHPGSLASTSLTPGGHSTAGSGSTVTPSTPTRASAPGTVKVALVTDLGNLNDGGFNQLSYAGYEQARVQYGFPDVVIQSQVASDAEYTKNITQAAQQADMVIGEGFLMQNAIYTVALQFPNKKFALIDGCATNPATPANCVALPNVAALFFKEQEAGCLVGAIAGQMEVDGKSKVPKLLGYNTISAVGGLPIPPVLRYIAGYKYCAQKVDPNVNVAVNYSNDFVDSTKCKAAADSQIANQHADIIFQVAGGCGIGVFDSATQHNVYSIGVDVDQSKDSTGAVRPSVITSALKRIDHAVYDIIQLAETGGYTGFVANPKTFGLLDNSVGFATPSSDVPTDAVAKAMEFADMIKSGALVPPEQIP